MVHSTKHAVSLVIEEVIYLCELLAQNVDIVKEAEHLISS